MGECTSSKGKANQKGCTISMTFNLYGYAILIGASVSEPHTGELAGGFSICMYVRYVRYIRDSVYLYDLFKRRPAPSLGTRSTAMRPGYEVWVGALMS